MLEKLCISQLFEIFILKYKASALSFIFQSQNLSNNNSCSLQWSFFFFLADCANANLTISFFDVLLWKVHFSNGLRNYFNVLQLVMFRVQQRAVGNCASSQPPFELICDFGGAQRLLLRLCIFLYQTKWYCDIFVNN